MGIKKWPYRKVHLKKLTFLFIENDIYLIYNVLQQLKHVGKSNASFFTFQNTTSSLMLRFKSESPAVQPAQLSHNHNAAFGATPTTLSFLQDRIHFSCTTAGCCFGEIAPLGSTCTFPAYTTIALAPSCWSKSPDCESIPQPEELPETPDRDPTSRAAFPINATTPAPETPLDCDGGWWLAPPPPAGSPPPDPFHDDWPFW